MKMKLNGLTFAACLLFAATCFAQTTPLPAPQAVPQPGPATDAPYAPTAILPGGVVVSLYPPGSPFLNMKRVREPEKYNLSKDSPGRVNSIVNIHNPSIEIHTVDGGLNTGAAVILVAGGGHRTLNVGGEGADFVPFFYNYGVNTIVLRNRLHSDGYDVSNDATWDVQQAIRLVRAHAAEWKIDPHKIGVVGFSAGGELSSGAAVFYDVFDKKNSGPGDPLAGISSRSSTPAPRPSRPTERRLRSRAICRPRFLSAPDRTIRFMPCGPTIISGRCWPPACPIWKCISMAMAVTPAIRFATAAA
jgi:endo-1,4-beta-xylanase